MGNQVGDGYCSRETDGDMNMVGGATYAEAFALEIACGGYEVGVKFGPCIRGDRWQAVFCAEDNVNEKECEGLRHEAILVRRIVPADTEMGCNVHLE